MLNIPVVLIIINSTFSVFSWEYVPRDIVTITRPSMEICIEDASALDNGTTVRAFCAFGEGKHKYADKD